MEDQFIRARMLLGKEAMEKLFSAHVAIFGVGGVGSFVAEALARSGVGEFSIFDGDTVCLSNLNRQLIATHKTIGLPKAEVAERRILEINPNAKVNAFSFFYNADNADAPGFKRFSYIIDAIDMVSSKILLVEKAKEFGVPIISSMGAGNKLDPTGFIVSDIYDTSVCPLAKVMRKELRGRGIDSLKVVYSKERPVAGKDGNIYGNNGKKRIVGSAAFVPSVAGLIIAGEVVKDLIKEVD